METPGKMYGLAVVFTILPIPFVVMRFSARRKARIPVSWDDWLILFALLATIATGILMICATAIGNLGGNTALNAQGKPDSTDFGNIVTRQTTYANTITQILALGPTKLAVLLFYRRIFSGRIFNICSWTLIVLVTIWTVAFFWSHLFICVPVIPTLNTGVIVRMGGKCVDGTSMFLAQSYADFSLDFLILVLPLPIIVKLQMRLTRKIQIFCIFLVGAMTVGASVARTAVQYGVAQEFKAGNPNQAKYQAPIVYWPLIEASVGIVASCLPILRPVIEKLSMDSIVSLARSLLRKSSRSSSHLKSPENVGLEDMDNSSEEFKANSNKNVAHPAYGAQPQKSTNIVSANSTSSRDEANGDNVYVQQDFKVDKTA